MTRRVIRVALLLILIVVGWGYGLAVGHYQWPPFSFILVSVQDGPPKCSDGSFICL